MIGVTGGLFVNTANFINFHISEYATTIGKVVTLRDEFPLKDEQIIPPIICYETEFMTMYKTELSSDIVTYNISFLINIIAKNNRELGELFKIVKTGLEVADSNVAGIGDFRVETLDILETWEIVKAPKLYRAMSIRVWINVVDFSV